MFHLIETPSWVLKQLMCIMGGSEGRGSWDTGGINRRRTKRCYIMDGSLTEHEFKERNESNSQQQTGRILTSQVQNKKCSIKVRGIWRVRYPCVKSALKLTLDVCFSRERKLQRLWCESGRTVAAMTDFELVVQQASLWRPGSLLKWASGVPSSSSLLLLIVTLRAPVNSSRECVPATLAATQTLRPAGCPRRAALGAGRQRLSPGDSRHREKRSSQSTSKTMPSLRLAFMYHYFNASDRSRSLGKLTSHPSGGGLLWPWEVLWVWCNAGEWKEGRCQMWSYLLSEECDARLSWC